MNHSDYVDPTLEQECEEVDKLIDSYGDPTVMEDPLEPDHVRVQCPDCGFIFDVWYKKFGSVGEFEYIMECEECGQDPQIVEVAADVVLHPAHKKFLKAN